MPMHRISIALPHHKFSCAHMTVFPDGTKERLHGHNYTIAIAVEVDRIDLPAMIPFVAIKDAVAKLCAEWKEHVLIGAANPWLHIASDTAEAIDFTLCGKRYVLPREDVLLFPTDNISVETLSAHVATTLRERLAGALAGPHVHALEITVDENPGQGASTRLALR